jgi:cytochrome c oxidase subunit 2
VTRAHRAWVLVTLGGLGAAGQHGLGGSSGAAEEAVEVVASRRGFRPKVVNAHRDEPVRLLLSTADEEHCFALDAFRIEKRLVPGKPVTVEFTPGRVGTFPYHCCLEPDDDDLKGSLVVKE